MLDSNKLRSAKLLKRQPKKYKKTFSQKVNKKFLIKNAPVSSAKRSTSEQVDPEVGSDVDVGQDADVETDVEHQGGVLRGKRDDNEYAEHGREPGTREAA